MKIGTYDPKTHTVIIGTRKIDGFAAGSFIEVTRNNPKEMTATSGGRGEYSLSKNPDKTGTVSIHLDPESESNDYLDSLAAAESVFPVYVQRLGETITDIVTAPEGWIEERPQVVGSAETPTRTWLIGAGEVIQVNKKTS